MIRYLYRPAFGLLRVYWFVFRPNTFGVVALLRYQDEILVVKNTYGAGRWLFPGGGIKKAELPEDALRREIKEELGVNLGKLRLLGTWVFTEHFKEDTVWFFESWVSDKKINPDMREIAKAHWYSLDSLPEDLGISTVRGLGLLKKAGH